MDDTDDVTVIAVTGGPSGGKTSFMAKARCYLEDHGFHVVDLCESATQLIPAGFSPDPAAWQDPLDFQDMVVQLSLNHEQLYREYIGRLVTSKKKVILTDRGILDGMAYVGREKFLALLERYDLAFGTLHGRYDAVIHLVSAAEGAEAFYTTEGHTARYENAELARVRDEATRKAWRGHPHVAIIDNRTGFDEKMQRSLSALARFLGIPEPVERERRFLVERVGSHFEWVEVHISQTYLLGTDEAVRRVRKRTVDGVTTYFYTEKRVGARLGEMREIDRKIALREYEALILDRDPACRTIEKVRHCFDYGGHYMEFDVFREPLNLRGLMILEVELSDLNEHVQIPPGWQVKEITGTPGYGNYDLSRRAP